MKEKLWNANYIKVMTTNFLLYFAFYLLTPLLPLYLSENFGATKDVIGIVLSGYTVAALIIRPFSGYVVDSFSRKKVLMVCLSAFAIFFAGYIAASTILMFAIHPTIRAFREAPRRPPVPPPSSSFFRQVEIMEAYASAGSATFLPRLFHPSSAFSTMR